MRKLLFCTFSLLFVVGCSDELSLDEVAPRLVVEGWIENNDFPVVILTQSLPVSTEYQEREDLYNYIVKWAKVTVSDGMDSVVLTGKYDDRYFPPFVYTTGRLRGEVGKKYRLTVEYRDYYVTAETSIPDVPPHCTFSVEPCADNDTLYQIRTTFRDNPSEKNYYQLFSRVGTDNKLYLVSYLGSIDDAVLDSVTTVPVYRGHQLTDKEYSPFFCLDDTVSVKVAQVDETSFRVWDSYTKTLSLSGNMFLSTSVDMETNIKGGYGYWCGYGAVSRHIAIRDSVRHVE